MRLAIPGKRKALWDAFFGPPESRLRMFALGFAATAMVLAGSFLNFLVYNEYPLARPEVAASLAALGGVSLVLALLSAASIALGRVAVPLLMTIMAADLNSDSLVLLLVGGAIGLLMLRFLRQALILLFSVVTMSALWGAAVSGGGERLAASPRAEPVNMVGQSGQADFAIVHLILDEHIGIEGIPDSLPEGAADRERLRQFYVGSGFRIFGGAYSESVRTVHAIPRAFGLSAPAPWGKGGLSGAVVGANAYFDSLQAMGFRIAVVQNDWLDFCGHSAVAGCTTHPAGRPIDVGDALPAADKTAILGYRFAALSNLALGALGLYDIAALVSHIYGFELPIIQIHQSTGTSTLNAMAAFQDTIESARSIAPGQVLFAHILLPHYPYVYDSDCGLRRFSEWLGRRSRATWSNRYAAYFEQMQCTTSKVAELISAVQQSPAAGKAVFIIHGDHGSRITHQEPFAGNEHRLSDRDLIDGYATFFAVSAPTIQPGYDSDRYPLRILLDALVKSGFRTIRPVLPPGFVHSVAIEDRARNPLYELQLRESDWWRGSTNEHVD